MLFTTISGTVLLVTGLIVLGSSLLAGGHAIGSGMAEAERERIRKAKENVWAYHHNINSLKEIKVLLLNYKDRLSRVNEHLTNSKNKFKSGGYVIDGHPLGLNGSNEFTSLMSQITITMRSIDQFVYQIDADIKTYNQLLVECNKIINGN